jgi:hypothetical protein
MLSTNRLPCAALPSQALYDILFPIGMWDKVLFNTGVLDQENKVVASTIGVKRGRHVRRSTKIRQESFGIQMQNQRKRSLVT